MSVKSVVMYYGKINRLVQKVRAGHNGKTFPVWSAIFVDATEAPLAIRSGAKGVEAMIMNFAPRQDS